MEEKRQIYHVRVYYLKEIIKDSGLFLTGHMILAPSPEAALKIANKYNIGYPIGNTDNIKERTVSPNNYPLNYCMERQKRGDGDVWYELENNGICELKKIVIS